VAAIRTQAGGVEDRSTRRIAALEVETMFKNTQAFSSFSVDDTKKARDFYGSSLGLPVKDEMMGNISAKLPNGAEVMMYPKPNHEAASFTVLNFIVPNIDEAVDDLTSKGVKFEQYTGEIQTDAKGIFRGQGPTIAWFKDPAGNILSLIEDETT
jgi:predicted enzyme related to lactoylglutathione lyase